MQLTSLAGASTSPRAVYCMRSTQYAFVLSSVSWRVRSVIRARSTSRTDIRCVLNPRSTRSAASSASSIFAGVDVTTSLYVVASLFCRPNASWKLQSYVRPRASRTVVNKRPPITSVRSMPATKVASGLALRMDCAANGFCWSAADALTGSWGWYRTPSGPTKGFVAVRVPSSSSPVGSGTGGSGGFRMGAHILGPGPASTAQARSSLSLSQSLCARCSSLAGTSFSVSGLSGRGSTSICGVSAPPGAAVPRNLTIISSISAGSKSPAMLTSRGPDLSCASTAATTPSRVSLESSSRLGSISRLSPNTAWFTLSWVRSSRLRWVLSSNMR
mmetsp:Transcript_11785/g.50792  ORF Transcript_11785/g.50792 Transcript_11785/m.50792 type:complete len:330 (-) Transcript_11785:2458-3447(-)